MGYAKTIEHVITKYRLSEKRVLDVGCGSGYWLSKFGPESVGLEINEANVKKAKQRGLNVITADIEHGLDKVPSRYFDAVFCSDILEHLTSPFWALTKLREKLREKGLLVVRAVTVPHNRLIRRLFNHFSPGYRSIAHHYIFTKETIEFLIERSGYRILETLPPFYLNKTISTIAWGLLGKSNFQNLVVVAEKSKKAYERTVMGRLANVIGKKKLDSAARRLLEELVAQDLPLDVIVTELQQELKPRKEAS